MDPNDFLYPRSVSYKKRNIERACDACRRRKTKCDGPQMANHYCTNCIQSSRPCTYEFVLFSCRIFRCIIYELENPPSLVGHRKRKFMLFPIPQSVNRPSRYITALEDKMEQLEALLKQASPLFLAMHSS